MPLSESQSSKGSQSDPKLVHLNGCSMARAGVMWVNLWKTGVMVPVWTFYCSLWRGEAVFMWSPEHGELVNYFRIMTLTPGQWRSRHSEPHGDYTNYDKLSDLNPSRSYFPQLESLCQFKSCLCLAFLWCCYPFFVLSTCKPTCPCQWIN